MGHPLCSKSHTRSSSPGPSEFICCCNHGENVSACGASSRDSGLPSLARYHVQVFDSTRMAIRACSPLVDNALAARAPRLLRISGEMSPCRIAVIQATATVTIMPKKSRNRILKIRHCMVWRFYNFPDARRPRESGYAGLLDSFCTTSKTLRCFPDVAAICVLDFNAGETVLTDSKLHAILSILVVDCELCHST